MIHKVENLNVKRELVKMIAGILYVVFIILTLAYFRFGFWLTVLFLATTSLIIQLVLGIKNKQPISFWGWVKGICYLIGILAFIRLLYFIMPPAWAYILTILFICAWIIYKRREKWLHVKWTIETMLFGMPIKNLPKNYWRKEE